MNREGWNHYLKWHLPVTIGFAVFTVIMAEVARSGTLLIWHLDWPIRLTFILEVVIGAWAVFWFGFALPFTDQEHLDRYWDKQDWDAKAEVQKWQEKT